MNNLPKSSSAVGKGKAWKSILAVFLGILITILMLWAVEMGFRYLTGSTPRKSNLYPHPNVPDGLGWAPEPNDTIPHTKRVGDRIVFDVVYHTDQYRRRAIPYKPNQLADQFVLFFGGSNTFGSGLSDSEAIPALVQRAEPDFHVYNYGFRGYGPQQMLSKLQAGSLKNELTEERGVVLFQYFHFHVFRAIGSMQIVSWAGGKHPYYYLDNNGTLRRDGTFSDGRRVQTHLYWLLSRSIVLQKLGVELPPRLETPHFALTCKIIRESKRIVMEEFPGSRFVVIVGLTSDMSDPFVNYCLEQQGIDYIDARLSQPQRREYIHVGDNHLNAKGTMYTAGKIISGLFDTQ